MIFGGGWMADTYQNYEELRKNHVKDTDYSVNLATVAGSYICIVAPHAGKIEPQTGEICSAIALDRYSFYRFNGLMAADNKKLHITSHVFDEPSARPMISRHFTALGVHGRNDTATLNGRDVTDGEAIYIGGLDEVFKTFLATYLYNAGFKTCSTGHCFLAENQNNVCNIGTSEKGAQIEIPKSLRDKIKHKKAIFNALAGALRGAVSAYELVPRI